MEAHLNRYTAKQCFADVRRSMCRKKGGVFVYVYVSVHTHMHMYINTYFCVWMSTSLDLEVAKENPEAK